MDIKQAYEYLQIIVDRESLNDYTKETLKAVIAAAEKQIGYIPKETYSIGKRKAYECKCGARLANKRIKYCSECGQAIDWQHTS